LAHWHGAIRSVDGLNRKPGLIRGCGGVGGDVPTENPKHDFTCTDSSELIQFTPAFGQTTELGEGAEVVLDASGQVIEFREQRGGQIPSNGILLCCLDLTLNSCCTLAQFSSTVTNGFVKVKLSLTFCLLTPVVISDTLATKFLTQECMYA
jgi:hypothetical protein